MIENGIILFCILIVFMIIGIKKHIKVLRNGSFALALIVLILTITNILINIFK